LSFQCRERLGVIDTANCAHVRGHDDGTGDDWSRDRTAAYFIDASEERPPLLAKISLDVCPAFQSIWGAAFGGRLL